MSSMKKALPIPRPDGSTDYSPVEFVPRGPKWPRNRWLNMLLALSLIDVFWVTLRCERYTGTISRMDRRDLPKTWREQARRFGVALGHGVSTRHALVWLEEEGDMLIGYAFSYVLHTAKVGDKVKIWVRPHSGHIRWIRNHTRPRKWWQF